jgi:hypothetical protein
MPDRPDDLLPAARFQARFDWLSMPVDLELAFA